MEIKIERDDIYANDDNGCRSWENLGIMACWHRNYNLGDIQPKETPEEHKIQLLVDLLDDEAMVKRLVSKGKLDALFNHHFVSLPLYLFDHSGITMNTTGFSCQWDSGQVGMIYASKDKIKEESIDEEQALKNFVGEVSTYDQELTGDVWWFGVYDDDEDIIESCGGFYGDDPKTNGMLEHIPEKYHHLLDEVEA